MWRTLILALFSMFIAITACSSRDEDSSHSFRSYQENGVTIAETTGGPKYIDPLFEYEMIITLDQNPEIEESQLYQPFRFLMDEEGRYYIQDFGNNRIAVFDEAGKYHHSIGRQGQGPGEFLSTSLISVSEGYVTVLDYRQQRTSIFKYDGTFVEHLIFRNARTDIQTQVSKGPNGTKILVKQNYHFEHRPKIITSWGATVFSADDDTLSTIETDPVHEATLSQTTEASTGGYFLGNPHAVYHPGKGILLSTGVDPVMEWFNLSGEHIQTIRLDIPPEPVTAEERSAIYSRLDKEIEEAQIPMMQAITNEKRRIAEVPDFKGYWCKLTVDESGYIWAQKPYPYYLDEYPERSTYLIFSPEGEYFGMTVVPTTSGFISKGHFLSILWDEETGAPSLSVYKIHPAVQGLEYP